MEAPVFLPASQILARLLTVDGAVSGLDADMLDGYQATDFAPVAHTHSYQPLDAELTAIAGLTSAANTVPSFTGSGTAALLTVGTGANNLVQLTAASKLPAVDGSLLTGISGSGLAADGSVTGATTAIQPFTLGIQTGKIAALADSANAIGFYKQDGTTQIAGFDSNGRRLILNGATTDTNAIVLKPNGGDGFIAYVNTSGVKLAEMTYGAGVFFLNAIGGVNLEFRTSTTAGSSILYRIQTASSFYRVQNVGGYAVANIPATGLTAFLAPVATTNTINAPLTLNSTLTSGTVANGFGTSLAMQARSSTTDSQDQGRLAYSWITATHASRASKGQLTSFYTSTERAAMTWGSDSSGPLLSFGTVTTPIAIQVLATGAGATADDIISALQALGLVKQS